MKKIIIAGAGGWAREVAEIIEKMIESGFEAEILGYAIDSQFGDIGEQVGGYRIISYLDNYENQLRATHFVAAFGNSELRERVSKELENCGLEPFTAIHPNAIIGKRSNIGKGSVVNAGVIISTDVEIGNSVLINFAVTIGHDTRIANYATLLPGVRLAGNINVYEHCLLGTNAVVIEKLTIGKRAVLGAGAVLFSDLDENKSAIGNPAKIFFRKVN